MDRGRAGTHGRGLARPRTPVEAPTWPGPDRDRLSAAATARPGRWELPRPTRAEPRAGGLRDHPRLEGSCQGARSAGFGFVTIEPLRRATGRQAAIAFRPARVR